MTNIANHPEFFNINFSFPQETFQPISGYEKLYRISNYGRVKSVSHLINGHLGSKRKSSTKILKCLDNGKGYQTVVLCVNYKKKRQYIHRLVAIAFIPNPEDKPQINHKKGIKIDNRASQLEWCTEQENSIHAHTTGLIVVPKGKNNHNSVSINQFSTGGEFIKTWDCVREAAEYIGITTQSISGVLRKVNRIAGGFHWAYA